MMRKTLIAAAAFVGLAVAGTVASATPASAGYACGPWNGWCRYYAPPSFSFGWYGGPYYGKPYGYRHYGHNNWRGGNKYYRGGGNKKHAYKHNRNRRHR
jgi:hypothetical protein